MVIKQNIYQLMQQAVDIVGSSEHPANKIAATLAGDNFSISKVNFWPEPIKTKIGADIEIGNASGTVHAETACLIAAPGATKNSSLFLTDPPCPNCVKNMVEAGVKSLYIDHKGFDKDFAARRGDHVRDMSLEICEQSGISVYKIFRKEQRTETIVAIKPGYAPAIEKPARTENLTGGVSEENFRALIKSCYTIYKDQPFALALAYSDLTESFSISAEIHAVAGFTSKAAMPEGKYNYLLQPVHRVLMTAARRGLKIDRNYLFCSRVPTAREQVNLVGAGFKKLYLGDDSHARDEFGIQALKMLTDAGILNVQQ